jgi:hypothetical protein
LASAFFLALAGKLAGDKRMLSVFRLFREKSMEISAYKRKSRSACTSAWSWKRDLNTRPAHYECAALPTELFQQISVFIILLYLLAFVKAKIQDFSKKFKR